MSKLTIDIKYGMDIRSNPDEFSNQEITFNYIQIAVADKYKQGLEGQKRRIFSRIQNKFDAAIENKEESIELESAEEDFIKDAFRDAKFPPLLARYVVMLEDEVDKLGKE